jgi:hypothetical protein
MELERCPRCRSAMLWAWPDHSGDRQCLACGATLYRHKGELPLVRERRKEWAELDELQANAWEAR